MSIRYRVRAWALLSTSLGLSFLIGCSSSSSTPAPASSSASSAPTPNVAPDPAQAAASAPSSDNAGVQPGMEGDGANSGMVNSGMANSGMAGMSGMGDGANSGMVNSGMAGMSGMSGMGDGANSGMVNSGMAGMAGMGPPSGMSSDFSGMPGMSSPGGGVAGMESIGAGMPGMGGMGMGGMGMGGMNGGPAIQDPAPAEDADYMSKAKYAFAIGKEAAAEQYAIAEIMSNDAEAANLLQQIRFAMGPRKPTLTLRFAIGVELEAPTSITDYKPIGRTQFAQNNGQGGGSAMGEPLGMMSGGGMGGGGQGGAAGQKSLGDLTGRFGEELIKSFETMWDSGAFGSVFSDVQTIVPVNRLNQNNRMGMSGMGMSGMGMSGGMSGPGMNDIGAGMPGGEGAPGAAPATSDSLGIKATPGKVATPGCTYLGTGKESELLGKAEAEGIDYMFLFDVTVKPPAPRQQLVQNDTKLRLISVKDKKNLGGTMTLNNNKVDREMAQKADADEVAKQMTNFFRKVEGIKLQDMVALKPEQAQARIKSLIEKKSKDVLPILMEVKLYHSQGLLNDEERNAAYQLIMPNGLAFANGSPEDRDFVLSPLLPGYK